MDHEPCQLGDRGPGHRPLTGCASLVDMSDHEKTFAYDEEPLEKGKYREWFWSGLQEAQVAYLRLPARVDKVEPEPVAYDGWESEQPRKWQHEAACAEADPEIFFNGGNQPKLAYQRKDAEWRKYCPQCPVREICLASARESESVGIWGGVYRYHPRNSSDLHYIEELDDRI